MRRAARLFQIIQILRGKPDALDLGRLRAWIRTRGKLRIRYSDDAGQDTDRVIWPIAVAYFEAVRLIVAWCELRQAFRHFRTDRIQSAEFLEERFPTSRQALRAAWWREEQTGFAAKRFVSRSNGPERTSWVICPLLRCSMTMGCDALHELTEDQAPASRGHTS